VWNQFTYVYDQTNKLPIQQTTRTFAFDRRTAQLVNCCGANVNGDQSVKQSGYVGLVLPIGTEKKTYPVFIPDVKKAVINALFLQQNATALVTLARAEKNTELKKEIVQKLSVMKSKEATDYLLELLK